MDAFQLNLPDSIKPALTLFKSGRFTEANISFAQLLNDQQAQAPAHYFMGIIAAQENEWDSAIGHFEIAINIDSSLPLIREKLLNCFLNNQKWDEAIKIADSLALDGSIVGYEAAAFANRQLGNHDEAKTMLEKALSLAPHRDDLAKALAGQSATGWTDPWPLIDPEIDNFKSLSAKYAKNWGAIKSEAPMASAAKALGYLHDPGSLTDAELPIANNNTAPTQRFPAPSAPSSDIRGLKVLFGPVVIAGVSPIIANWMKSQGADAQTVEFFPNFLKYRVDYQNNSSNQNDLIQFSQNIVKIASKFDVICFDFASSFSYLPYYGVTFLQDGKPVAPYHDVEFLKNLNKKIIFIFWGSDCFSQSFIHHNYLKFLGLDWIPTPPQQNRIQHENIKVIKKYADVIVAPEYFTNNLPQTIKNWDVCLDPKEWRAKETYNTKISTILTAPTSKRKKNYDILDSALKSLTRRYPEVSEFSVQGKPHHEVPLLYAQADLGLEQATQSFGLLAVEMMAIGLPLIANFTFKGIGGIREYAPLISFTNIRELYSRLEECVTNPENLAKIGKLGREYAMTYHTNETQGRILANLISQTMEGENISQIASSTYDNISQIWDNNPESVLEFKYYDISVPLFCALKEYEYAIADCGEAITNNYRIEKFRLWTTAIQKYYSPNDYNKSKKILYEQNNEKILSQINDYIEILSSSQKLFNEVAKAKKEYEILKEELNLEHNNLSRDSGNII
ncbi:MAG: hypothetical protein LBO66_08245 [Deltaproteobacteria bacterium]|jgi:glycosyltransferase involved in cell wall biosynthesis|nr:hypothetical protein [Deltaproteobacteria bacterium]